MKNKDYDEIISEDISEEIKKENEEILREAKEEKAEEEKKEIPLTNEEEDFKTQFIRMSADFANYKRRVEKEKSDIYKYANEKLIVELLAVVDNLDRALDHSTEDTNDSSIVDGVELVRKSLMDTLTRSGLEHIEAVGQPFDHNLHHAVMTEDCDEHDSETVTAELQKGYRLNNKVIRPSMVKVSN